MIKTETPEMPVLKSFFFFAQQGFHSMFDVCFDTSHLLSKRPCLGLMMRGGVKIH